VPFSRFGVMPTAVGSAPAPLPSDEELIRLVAAGHRSPFEVIFARHRRAALALAGSICGPALAEEAVQDAFFQVSRSAASYRPELGSARGWLLGIVRHRAIDAFRRDARHAKQRADAQELERLAARDEIAINLERRDDARIVRSLLGTLPENQRRIIAMAYFGELSHTEIAGAMGLPVGTVKGRIRLGLAKLREPLARSVSAVPVS
jgi:RNA polymerase sigma-70 factor (ECF subfamily)